MYVNLRAGDARQVKQRDRAKEVAEVSIDSQAALKVATQLQQI